MSKTSEISHGGEKDKTKPGVIVTIRVSEDVRDQADQLGQVSKRTRSNILQLAIEAGLPLVAKTACAGV